jgi:hypothetical protein
VCAFQARLKLEEEKIALVSFVRDFDVQLEQKTGLANYTPGGGTERAKRARSLDGNESFTLPSKLSSRYGSSLLNETPEVLEEDEIEDLLEVEMEPGSPSRSMKVLDEEDGL